MQASHGGLVRVGPGGQAGEFVRSVSPREISLLTDKSALREERTAPQHTGPLKKLWVWSEIAQRKQIALTELEFHQIHN